MNTSSVISTIKANTDSFLVSNLQPYTLYSFAVEPYLGYKVGEKSKMVTVRTDFGGMYM